MYGIVRSLRNIYKLKYVLLNIVIFALYYLVFNEILQLQQLGLAFTPIPAYIVYLMVASASVTLTVSIYSVRNTRRNAAKESAATTSIATTIASGIIGGCGCSGAFIFPLLSAFGVSSATALSADVFFSNYAAPIFVGLAALNILIVVYYLNKFSKPQCAVARRKRGRPAHAIIANRKSN